MEESGFLKRDGWLSGHLGREAYHLAPGEVVCAALADRGSAESRRLGALARAPGFLDAKAPVTRLDWVATLVAHGLKLVDTTVTFEKPAEPAAWSCLQIGGMTCRRALPEDRGAVGALARESFTFSRFHQDPGIPRAVADRIKEDWATNFFSGARGDHLVVAEVDGVVGGFLLLLTVPERTLVIDLIAVGAGHRRRGLAAGMIRFAESVIDGITLVRVGTQLANVPSIRCYEGLGFRLVSGSHVLHRNT